MTKEIVRRARKEGVGTIWLEKNAYNQKKWREEIRAKIVNPGQPG